jgi:hypothetical protein
MASGEERLNPASGKTANARAIPKEIRALAEMHGCYADRPEAAGTDVAYRFTRQGRAEGRFLRNPRYSGAALASDREVVK